MRWNGIRNFWSIPFETKSREKIHVINFYGFLRLRNEFWGEQYFALLFSTSNFSVASLDCHWHCAITVLIFEQFPFKPTDYQTQRAHHPWWNKTVPLANTPPVSGRLSLIHGLIVTCPWLVWTHWLKNSFTTISFPSIESGDNSRCTSRTTAPL